MKKILFTICFLISFSAIGQVYQLMPQYGYNGYRMNFDSTLSIPTTCGVPTLKSNLLKKSAIAYDTCNKRFYLYDAKLMAWDTIKGGGGSSIDTTSLSNRINNKIDSIKRSSDSVYYYKNGVRTFAYRDSVGSASDTASVVKATVHNAEATTLTKGTVVYLFGATGNVASVKRAYNVSDTFSSKTFAIVKNDIASGATGTVITQGVVDKLNLGAYNEGDIVWLDSVAGQFTKNKPSAPYHQVFIGVVERANAGNGQLYVKVQNGYELGELHNVSVNSQADNDILYYQLSTKLWKAKSPYQLVDTSKLSSRIDLRMKYTDTTSMLTNYAKTSAVNLKVNISDTANMLTNYVRSITLNGYAKYTDTSNMLSPYLRKVDTATLSSRIDLRMKYTDTANLSSRIDLRMKYTDTASLSNRINLKMNYTDTASLSNRINLKVNISDTSTMLSKYLTKTDTATLSSRIDLRMKYTDTASLSNRINLKMNYTDTASLSSRINTKLNSSDSSVYQTKFRTDTMRTNIYNQLANELNISDTATMLSKYLRKTDTASLSNRIDNVTDFNLSILSALGSDVKSYNPGIPNPLVLIGFGALTSQRVTFTGVWLPKAATITGVKWIQSANGSYTASNYNGVGLYTYSGGTLTLVASSSNDGTIWSSGGSTVRSKAFSSTYSASSGLYFIAAMYSSSAQTTAPTIAYSGTSVAFPASFDFTNSAKLSSFINTQTALPSSQASSGLTANGLGYGFYLY